MIHLIEKASGASQFRSLLTYRRLVKGDLYVFEVSFECIGGEEIDFGLRVLPGVGGQARLVGAAV